MMIVIGAIYMKSTTSTEDYFLGGRGLSGWVAALSAQASDMSGWLNEDVYIVGFLNTDPSKIEGLYLTFEQLPLSLQFEKKKGEKSINGEFAIVTPQAYAIPLKNM